MSYLFTGLEGGFHHSYHMIIEPTKLMVGVIMMMSGVQQWGLHMHIYDYARIAPSIVKKTQKHWNHMVSDPLQVY